MAILFYERAKLLDPCKSVREPTPEQIIQVYSMIEDERYARYFFNQLDNPVWVPLLEKQGYFSKSPEPTEVKPGSYIIPIWPAILYLRKVAQFKPDTVVNVAKTIHTENSRTQEYLIEALAEIPPEKAIKSVSNIVTWLSSRFSDYLPVKYGLLIEKWISTGYVSEAMLLFDSLLNPVLIESDEIQKISSYRAPLRFRGDHYWTNEIVQKYRPQLLKLNSQGLLSVFERQIKEAIELTKKVIGSKSELSIGYIWRPDIPFRSSDTENLAVLDILVDGLRDALLETCEHSTDIGRKYLSSYLSDSLIFQRVAIFALRKHGSKYPDLVNWVLERRDYLEESKYSKEYQGILRDQFNTASPEVRNLVISWILEGPLDIDSRALRHAQWENRDATEDDKKNVLYQWKYIHFSLIKDYLSSDVLTLYNSLVAQFGERDITERPKISVTTSWGGAPSPVSAEQMVKMSFDELFTYILDYKPRPDEAFLDPQESLAETLRTVVKENPEKYIEFAARLTDPNIRYVYIINFLNGISEGLLKPGGKLSESLIILCETVISTRDDIFEYSSLLHEPGLLGTHLEIARLLESALRSNDPYLERVFLDRIRSMLFTLLNHNDPEKDETSSFDPFTQSLNCVRGEAIHGLMQYSLYVDRQRKKIEAKEVHQPFLEPEVKAAIELKLDKSKDSSLAVHSVFGAYLPQLYYLDKNWTEQNIERILPPSENSTGYWQAAWDAYLLNSNVYRDLFRILTPHYKRSLGSPNLYKDKEKYPWASPNERLAQHIMMAYLNDLTGFGHENGLLDLFFENSPDQVRANAIAWLSKVLGNEKPLSDTEIWSKLRRLWQQRIDSAEKSNNIGKYQQEISEFTRWLDNSPVKLDDLSSILSITIKYITRGFESRQIALFLVKYSAEYPLLAIDLLDQLIKAAKEPWWGPDEKDEDTILRNAIVSGQLEAKSKAIQIINRLGEQGDFRWKSLLD